MPKRTVLVLSLALVACATAATARAVSPSASPLRSGVALPATTFARPSGPIVPWLDARAAPIPERTPSPAPTDVRLCRTSELVVWPVGGNGATGWSIGYYALANTSATPCLVRDRPGVRLFDARGGLIFERQANEARGGIDGPGWVVLRPDLSRRDRPFPPGLAMFGIGTYGWCPPPPVARYEFTFPWDPAPLSLSIPPAVFSGGRCDVPDETPGPELMFVDAVFPASPPEPSPTSTPRASPLAATIIVPPRAIAGDTLEYYLVLSNTSAEPLHFEGCPAYGHWLQLTRVTPTLNAKGELEAVSGLAAKDTMRVLNCDGARGIAPYGTVTFAMRLAVLPDAERGEATLRWELEMTPTKIAADATIEIVSP